VLSRSDPYGGCPYELLVMSAENCSKEVDATDSLEMHSGLIVNFFVDWFRLEEETKGEASSWIERFSVLH
jgi:hypothetical protein